MEGRGGGRERERDGGRGRVIINSNLFGTLVSSRSQKTDLRHLRRAVHFTARFTANFWALIFNQKMPMKWIYRCAETMLFKVRPRVL